MLDRKFSRPPAELARENFPTAGHANASTTENEPRIEPRSCISGAAVKSPLGAQTVLGDRHDPVV